MQKDVDTWGAFFTDRSMSPDSGEKILLCLDKDRVGWVLRFLANSLINFWGLVSFECEIEN